ncbi:ras association domain-containing protein 1-like [Oscarella lobularis]|uniref:ras association domain-containing protein 1-like n=1 Tax=Oscarella lobularis TaxID=121494 RepID=UPI003313DEC3
MTEASITPLNPLLPAQSSHRKPVQMASTAEASKPELSTPSKARMNSVTRSPRLARLRQGLENIKSWGKGRHRKQSSRQRIRSGDRGPERPYSPSGGHEFEPTSISSPHWCDQCGDFIWGIFSQPYRCKRCFITCHRKCRVKIVLDCRGPLTIRAHMVAAGEGETAWDCSIERGEDAEESNADREISPDSICLEDISLIDDSATQLNGYGKDAAEDGDPKMNLSKDGAVLSGTIQVYLTLGRPIHVLQSNRPSGSKDGGSTSSSANSSPVRARLARCQSFFMPDDTVKKLFVDSTTTAAEVIQMLLEKFQISDSPAKFALYESTTGKLKTGGRKLSDNEKPLVMTLLWKPDKEDARCFCLRDHTEPIIDWNSFAVAELLNFLKMLEREESRHLDKVRQRYVEYRERLIVTIREKFIEMSEGDVSV